MVEYLLLVDFCQRANINDMIKSQGFVKIAKKGNPLIWNLKNHSKIKRVPDLMNMKEIGLT